jgi:hypothetical protein
MFRTEPVLQALTGRIGWKQYSFPLMLDAINASSAGGRYFQDFHKAVTLQNIYDTMELENADDAQFNEYLSDLQRSAILRTLSAVFTSDDILEQTPLYRTLWNEKLKSRATTADFAGYVINPAPDASKCVRLKSLTLLFDGDGAFDVFICRGDGALVNQIPVTVESGKKKVLHLDELLPRMSDDDRDARYYVGYRPADAPEPLESDCPQWSKTYLFGYIPIESDADFAAPVETWRTYGLNLELASYSDFTDPIIRSAYLFDQAVGMQMAADIIEQTLNSTRSNKTERLTKEMQNALYNELNSAYTGPEFPYSTGLKNQIVKEIKKLHVNFFPKMKAFIKTPSCCTYENSYQESTSRFRRSKNGYMPNY